MATSTMDRTFLCPVCRETCVARRDTFSNQCEVSVYPLAGDATAHCNCEPPTGISGKHVDLDNGNSAFTYNLPIRCPFCLEHLECEFVRYYTPKGNSGKLSFYPREHRCHVLKTPLTWSEKSPEDSMHNYVMVNGETFGLYEKIGKPNEKGYYTTLDLYRLVERDRLYYKTDAPEKDTLGFSNVKLRDKQVKDLLKVGFGVFKFEALYNYGRNTRTLYRISFDRRILQKFRRPEDIDMSEELNN